MCKYQPEPVSNMAVNDRESNFSRWMCVSIMIHSQSHSGEQVDIFPPGLFRQQGWMLANYKAATQVLPDCVLLNNKRLIRKVSE